MTDETKTPDEALDTANELSDEQPVEITDDPKPVTHDDDDNKRLAEFESRLDSMKKDRGDLVRAENLIAETGGSNEVEADMGDFESEMYIETLRLRKLKEESSSVGIFGSRRKKELAEKIGLVEREIDRLDANRAGKKTVSQVVASAEAHAKKTVPSRQYMDDRIAALTVKIASLEEKIGKSDQPLSET